MLRILLIGVPHLCAHYHQEKVQLIIRGALGWPALLFSGMIVVDRQAEIPNSFLWKPNYVMLVEPLVSKSC
ncbi:hypothetical protein BN873_70017 [Candidatus Competibacter denitrificans Run_A_D11]|uniref:Uncharacterized protein n=1 Tax=Candidatus Competibacter denitrificans Run_A_D11 TaxID=1400863 RepID=W6MAR4_9GAMM|nr:hypothetical protein BN873_70017 [Candidatus Competibacter denitrificans Run_A_D11]